MTNRPSAKIRPARIGDREAQAEEVVAAAIWPQPLPVSLAQGFPLLATIPCWKPWRALVLLEAVRAAGSNAIECLAFMLRFSLEAPLWKRAAAGWSQEERDLLLSAPTFQQASWWWRADHLPRPQRLEDLCVAWRRAMGPRPSSRSGLRRWDERQLLLVDEAGLLGWRRPSPAAPK